MELLSLIVLFVLLGATAARTVIWIRRPSATHLTYALVFGAVTLTWLASTFPTEIDNATLPHLHGVVMFAAIIVAAAGCTLHLLGLSGAEPSHRTTGVHMAIAAAAIATLIVCWALAPGHDVAPDLTGSQPLTWPIAFTSPLFYVWVPCVLGVRTHLRIARSSTHDRTVRVGSATSFLGYAFAFLGIAAIQARVVLARRAWEATNAAVNLTVIPGLLLCGGGVLIYAAVPRTAPYITALHRIVLLRPLWRAVHRQYPDLALPRPDFGRTPQGLLLHARRMEIEILDALNKIVVPGHQRDGSAYPAIARAVEHPALDGTAASALVTGVDDDAISVALAKAYRARRNHPGA